MIAEKKDKAMVPGNWYLLASCEYCHSKHVVDTDSSKGEMLPKDFYQAECPSCLRIGIYAAAQIERYQHQSTQPVAAALPPDVL
ncbi:MAG TPA: hypothetical protein VK475_07695 [Pyrinomonadaceae bacterium]|nr:hypothetical protein [Pyrinomonadaceae bacterium]